MSYEEEDTCVSYEEEDTCTLHEYMYKHMLNQLYIRTCVHVYTQFTSTSACNFYQVSVLKQHVISVSKETCV